MATYTVEIPKSSYCDRVTDGTRDFDVFRLLDFNCAGSGDYVFIPSGERAEEKGMYVFELDSADNVRIASYKDDAARLSFARCSEYANENLFVSREIDAKDFAENYDALPWVENGGTVKDGGTVEITVPEGSMCISDNGTSAFVAVPDGKGNPVGMAKLSVSQIRQNDNGTYTVETEKYWPYEYYTEGLELPSALTGAKLYNAFRNVKENYPAYSGFSGLGSNFVNMTEPRYDVKVPKKQKKAVTTYKDRQYDVYVVKEIKPGGPAFLSLPSNRLVSEDTATATCTYSLYGDDSVFTMTCPEKYDGNEMKAFADQNVVYNKIAPNEAADIAKEMFSGANTTENDFGAVQIKPDNKTSAGKPSRLYATATERQSHETSRKNVVIASGIPLTGTEGEKKTVTTAKNPQVKKKANETVSFSVPKSAIYTDTDGVYLLFPKNSTIVNDRCKILKKNIKEDKDGENVTITVKKNEAFVSKRLLARFKGADLGKYFIKKQWKATDFPRMKIKNTEKNKDDSFSK